MSTKDTLRRLVDELPASEVDAAKRYLEYLRDTTHPLLRKLLEAPEDEEELTEEQLAAFREAREDLKAGRKAPLGQVKEEFGI